MPTSDDGRENGYVALWRCVRQNDVVWKTSKPFSNFQAWCDMILEAHWSTTPRQAKAGRAVVTLERGELAHSIRWFATRWHWGVGRVLRFLKLLADCHMIDTKTERLATHVRILQYETYNPLRNGNGTVTERWRNDGGTEQEEGKEGKKVRKKQTCPEPPPAFLAKLSLYANDERLCTAWPDLLSALQQANPGINVLAEVIKAHAWEVANPTKRKRNRSAYLHRWCAKAQDSIGRQSGQTQHLPNPDKEWK